MTEAPKLFDNVLNWLRAGYPEGVPPKDFYPLLALLQRSLSEQEVVEAAQSILRSTDGNAPVTHEEIHHAIVNITAQAPNAEEIQQVAARLASVGWPLAAASH
jgi:thioredoxin-like negative regulator of GroEL